MAKFTVLFGHFVETFAVVVVESGKTISLVRFIGSNGKSLFGTNPVFVPTSDLSDF